jgi:hypothetical protein
MELAVLELVEVVMDRIRVVEAGDGRLLPGDYDDDDLEDGDVARDGEFIRVPLKFMDEKPPPPPPEVDPRAAAHAAYVDWLSNAYKNPQGRPVCDAAPPPRVVSARREVVVITDQMLRDARAVCEAAQRRYVDDISNKWRAR